MQNDKINLKNPNFDHVLRFKANNKKSEPFLLPHFPGKRVAVYLESNSFLEIINFEDDFSSSYSFFLGEGANLRYFVCQKNKTENIQGETVFKLQEQSVLAINAVYFLKVNATQKIRIENQGKESRTQVNLGFLLQKKTNFNLEVQSNQEQEKTFGQIKIRGLVEDQAQANVLGKMLVSPKAQESEAYLDEKILLLSEQAKATAKPILLIETNEVKSSHGASISKVNEEDLFYLTSRGLSQKEAGSLIKKGILESLFAKIPEENPWKKEFKQVTFDR